MVKIAPGAIRESVHFPTNAMKDGEAVYETVRPGEEARDIDVDVENPTVKALIGSGAMNVAKASHRRPPDKKETPA